MLAITLVSLIVLCTSLADDKPENIRIKSNDLDIDGSNVCQRKTKETYIKITYYINHVTGIVYRETTCLFGRTCHKSKTKLVPKMHHFTNVAERGVIELFCCNHWQRSTPSATECTKPICQIACQNGGTCSNPDSCTCTPAFSGKYCRIPKDACKLGHSKCSQECIKMPDFKYRCACQPGYTLNANGFDCDDIDECTKGTDACGCVRDDGVCKTTCINTQGGYTCSCPTGYFLNSENKCGDRNECNRKDICKWKYVIRCVNKPGTYECKCRDGYLADYANKKCIEVNQCSKNNGGCSDNCMNVGGYHICTCNAGRVLDTDEKTCSDKTFKTAYVCQYDFATTLTCDNGKSLKIYYAFYGRLSKAICNKGSLSTEDTTCFSRSSPNSRYLSRGHVVIEDACQGQNNCLVMSTPDSYQKNLCPKTSKYLEVQYICE